MTSTKGGKPTKDAPISDNFNQQKLGPRASNALIRKARREAALAKQRIEHERKRQAAEFEKMEKELARAKREVGVKDPIPVVEEPARDEIITPEDDEKSAHRMLHDLRYAYRNSVGPGGKKGKQRLTELMENDADFKFAVKELMKIEASLLAAKIRKDGGDGLGSVNQSFFVVLKGLEAEIPVMASGDKTVDMKQITRAINPEENSYEPEEEINQRDVPEQLQKSVEGMEDL